MKPEPITVQNAAALAARWYQDHATPYPAADFSGRGIVIVAGGPRFSICAYVCLRALRFHGCALPVQLWHLGPKEYNAAFAAICREYDAEHVDARAIQATHPHARLNGWELKPYAIQWAPWQEVLLLDADNVPCCDPTYLFDCPAYQQTGTILWPDYARCKRDAAAWQIFGRPYVDEPEVESGQVLTDKARSWPALTLANYYGERSEFYFGHVYGDKELFHHAWPVAGCPYHMPRRPIHTLKGVMCQHDPEGRRVFQHRNWQKWTLERGSNLPRPGFQFERECLQWLEELAALWSPAAQTLPTAADRAAIAANAHTWLYRRIGYDERPVTLRDDGTFAKGGAGCERYWTMRDGRLLIAHNDGRLMMDMGPDNHGGWTGRWLHYERMPAQLAPVDLAETPEPATTAAPVA